LPDELGVPALVNPTHPEIVSVAVSNASSARTAGALRVRDLITVRSFVCATLDF